MPFIVLEGLDGAGKTTQLNKLTSHLEEKGIRYRFLHFPRYDAPVYGELISRFLRGEFGEISAVDPYLVALLYAGDRNDAAAEIRGWLEEGIFVVTDRYVYSNIAFQCSKLDDVDARTKLRNWILNLEFNHNNLPRPDLSLFLDVPFEFTRSRLTQTRKGEDRSYLNGARDIHEESLDLQRRVRETYLECSSVYGDLQVVDCSSGKPGVEGMEGSMDSPEANFGKILMKLQPLIDAATQINR